MLIITIKIYHTDTVHKMNPSYLSLYCIFSATRWPYDKECGLASHYLAYQDKNYNTVHSNYKYLPAVCPTIAVFWPRKGTIEHSLLKKKQEKIFSTEMGKYHFKIRPQNHVIFGCGGVVPLTSKASLHMRVWAAALFQEHPSLSLYVSLRCPGWFVSCIALQVFGIMMFQ